MGHINLFRLAKKHVDFLVVGLDNDQTIRKTKGRKRPINNYKRRSEFLSEISGVEGIFRIAKVFKHGDKDSFKYISRLFKRIKPTHVFTSIKCDDLWKKKKVIAESLGIKFIPEKSKVMHTSDILKILETDL